MKNKKKVNKFYTANNNVNSFDIGGNVENDEPEKLNASVVSAVGKRKQFDNMYDINIVDRTHPEYEWEQSDEFKETLSNEYKELAKRLLPFYESLKGGKYNNIYEAFINAYINNSDYMRVNPLGFHYDFFPESNDESLNFGFALEDYAKANNIDTRTWIVKDNISENPPKSFNAEQQFYDKEVQPFINGLDYVASLYNTNRAQRGLNRAQRYASRKRLPGDTVTNMLGWKGSKLKGLSKEEAKDRFMPIGQVNIVNENGMGDSYNDNNTIKLDFNSPIIRDPNDKFTSSEMEDAAHEAAHTRSIYNKYRYNWQTPESPEYGLNYRLIRPKHKKWLTPVNPIDNHDFELTEAYSDLMGLRAYLHELGIVDGTKERYKNKHIKELLDYQVGKFDEDEGLPLNNRYLAYHPNIRHVRKALNRVWADGGDINEFKRGGHLTKYGVKVNKFTEDGQMDKSGTGAGTNTPNKLSFNEASKAQAQKAFSVENLGSTLGAIGGSVMTLAGNAMKNAEVDTTKADNALEAVKNHKLDTSSLDALANSYDFTPWVTTDFDFKDFRPSAGELAMNTLNSTISGVTTGASVGGGWGAIIGGVLGAGTALGGMAAGRSAAIKEEERLENEAMLENMSSLTRGQTSAEALMKQKANQNLMNVAAYGGSLGNFSGDFSNDVMFINEGGTHEQNPLEGVPMGFDREGTPNLVEEGEIIYNDYVFSNRLKANKKGLENVGFTDKYKDWTFAKIAEDLQKESAERPNDILSKQTLDDMMNRLIQVQEEVRMKKQQRKQNRFDLGGFVNKFDGENGSYLPDGSYVPNIPGVTFNLLDTYLSSISDQLLNAIEYANEHDDTKYVKYVPKPKLTLQEEVYNELYEQELNSEVNRLTKINDKKKKDKLTNDQILANAKANLEKKDRKSKLETQVKNEVAKREKAEKERIKVIEDRLNTGAWKQKYNDENRQFLIGNDIPTKEMLFRHVGDDILNNENITPEDKPEDKPKDKTQFDWDKFGNDALRIGSPIAANISALARNLAKPDYSQNERALNEARTAPTSNIVAPTEDISIRPVDINYMANMLRNQGNATLRNINNTALNEQQAIANYMVANNQLQEQLADAYMKSDEANLARFIQENEFNRGNDQFEAQIALQNFANNAVRHNAIINATAQAAAANSALDAARAQGIYGSESNLAESLSGVGSENHWAKIIDEHPALLYTMLGEYKSPKKANGGKLLTRNKRRK